MKVVFIISHMRQGGAELALIELASLLKESIEVVIVSDLRGSTIIDKLDQGVSCIQLDHVWRPSLVRVRTILRQILCLRRELREADVIIALSVNNLPTARMAGIFMRRRVLLLWEHTIAEKHYSRKLFRRLFARDIDYLVCPSPYSAESATRFLNYSGSTKTIPNCVRVSPEIRKDTGRPKRLVFIGRLAPEKDVALAIRTIRELKDLESEVCSLLVIGDGPEFEKAVSLCQELELDDRCRFIGSQDDPWKEVEHQDIVIITSLYESFSNVCIEAISGGNSVVMLDRNSPRLVKDCALLNISDSFEAKEIGRLVDRLPCIDASLREREAQKIRVMVGRDKIKKEWLAILEALV